MITSMIDFFEETVVRNGSDIAIISEEKQVSFQDLANDARKLGYYIEKNSKRMNSPIAVYLPKSVNAVIADIGIIYSHNIFMNLDIKLPLERVQNIISHIKPLCIITTRDLKPKLEGIQYNILLIEEVLDFDLEEVAYDFCKGIDTDPFCIINTSGSTGTPKGVILNHISFFDFTSWALETFSFREGEMIMGCLSPIVFDIYVFELCMLMRIGATMVLLEDKMAMFPMKMLDFLKETNVNFLFWVPSIMVTIANGRLLDAVNLGNQLKDIWFAGEVFPTKQFRYWYDKLPETRFTNLYGPIEITLDCTYYTIQREISEDENLPIGFPCKNTDILILNDQDVECGINEKGELCVRGISLAMGYYNDAEKTKKVFVQNPLNNSYPETIYRTGDIVYRNDKNEIMFVGRRDSLIKHMGYRIELSEIEHIVIDKINIVKYACAVYDWDRKEIVLFYEAEQKIEAIEFRKNLLQLLPKYMIPKRYELKDELPRNVNGKIDRQFLNNEINGTLR